MVCLKEKGIRVPEDIRLSGLGHGIVADILTPRLTTVEYAYKTSGREAAEDVYKRQAFKERQMFFLTAQVDKM